MAESGEPCVYLDLDAMDRGRLRERFPTVYENCLEHGVDITREPIPVVPAAHYSCGGIHADLDGLPDLDEPHVHRLGHQLGDGHPSLGALVEQLVERIQRSLGQPGTRRTRGDLLRDALRGIGRLHRVVELVEHAHGGILAVPRRATLKVEAPPADVSRW